MPKCSNCGAELGVGNRFCTSCGTAASENVELPKEGPEEKLIQQVLISDNNDNSMQNTVGNQNSTKGRNYRKPIIIAVVVLVIIAAVGVATNGAAPLRAKYSIMLGNKYLKEGNYDEAILAFEKVIQIEEKNVEARLKLSDLYLKTGKNDKAKTLLKETLTLDKTNQNTYVLLGSIYRLEKNYVDLIKLFSEGLSACKEKDKLQAEFDKLLTEIKLPEINTSVSLDDKYTPPEQVQLQIGEDKFELPVNWKVKNADTSKIGNVKLEGNIQYINKPIVINLDVKMKPLTVTEKKINKKGNRFVIEYSYPVISAEGRYAENAAKLNSIIEKDINKALAADLESAKAAAGDESLLVYNMEYEFKIGYEMKYNKDGVISILMTYYSYTGGAHGMGAMSAYNYNIVQGKELKLQDVFNKDINPNDIIKDEVIKQMQANKGNYFDDSPAVIRNYKEPFNFYVTEKGVVVFFSEYEIAPYSSGIPEFLITKGVSIK